jgi:hypothetical protein
MQQDEHPTLTFFCVPADSDDALPQTTAELMRCGRRDAPLNEEAPADSDDAVLDEEIDALLAENPNEFVLRFIQTVGEGEMLIPALVHGAMVVASSGALVGAYNLLKTWVEARNGRKLKIKVGDIEVEATQMKERDVMRIFELLQEAGDRKKIRELLMATGQANQRESS